MQPGVAIIALVNTIQESCGESFGDCHDLLEHKIQYRVGIAKQLSGPLPVSRFVGQ
jgi:hypothetical protein